MKKRRYTKNEATNWPVPNYWDVIAFSLIVGLLVLLTIAATKMASPYNIGQPIKISLSMSNLPMYALRTVLRMFIALFCSLIFTFIFGSWAAKSKKAERIIIPLIDVLQSVPVLSFLSITVAGFILLFRGSMLGPECAAIFAIFTSQVWNMTLSFYQSLKSVPKDLKEVSMIYQLSRWQVFWKLEVPFAMPGLLWNMMMSMSGSWFYVVASEAISVANQHINLPGIGSYIAIAISHADKTAVYCSIFTMLIVILLYDQLLFRPLVQWSEKFRMNSKSDEKFSRSWVVNLFQRTRVLRKIFSMFIVSFNLFVDNDFFNRKVKVKNVSSNKSTAKFKHLFSYFVNIIFIITFFFICYFLIKFLMHHISMKDFEHVALLGIATAARVLMLVFLCSLIWVPVGVWIGSSSRATEIVQPIIQFLAAFPANLLFPIVAILIVKYNLNVNIWTSPLMVLGTQWYILFNVIAGASTIPEDVKLVAANLGVKGFVRWRRIIFPAIMPFFITGVITAAGGAWNASILAEAVNWGSIKLNAFGLGEYITHYTRIGGFHHVVFGTIIMCLFVLIINRLLWRPLYNIAIERFQ